MHGTDMMKSLVWTLLDMIERCELVNTNKQKRNSNGVASFRSVTIRISKYLLLSISNDTSNFEVVEDFSRS